MTAIRNIPLGQITPDPGQPRKLFNQTALRELANSIAATGLLQPITVRQVGPEAFVIIAGERRFRASQLNDAATIRAIVSETNNHASVRVLQIIENDQRVDVTPLEQARSYRALMDETGWTVEELAAEIGKSPHRITERITLLALQADYQALFEKGGLTPTEAYELARLSPRGQSVLFNAIRTGRCKTVADLKAAAAGIADAERQTSLIPEEAAPKPEDIQAARAFQRQLERIVSLVNSGIRNNQIVAVHKVDPDHADHVADMLALLGKDIRRIEIALRNVAVQADLMAAQDHPGATIIPITAGSRNA